MAIISEEPMTFENGDDRHREFPSIDSLHTFKSGAQSSEHLPAFHLVPVLHVLERLTPRFAIGAAKYGVDAWRKGLEDREWLLDRANHGLRHYLMMLDKLKKGEATDEGDDDLAGAMWALAVIAESEWQHGPLDTDDSRHPATTAEVERVTKMEIRARERVARAALEKPIEVAPAPSRPRLTCCMHCGGKAEEHLSGPHDAEVDGKRGLYYGRWIPDAGPDAKFHIYEQPDGNYTGLRGVFD